MNYSFGNGPVFRKALLFVFLAACGMPTLAQPSLLICIPGSSSIQSIQKSFETVMGPGKILAFARMKDLEGSLASSPNAAIMVPAPFIHFTPGYTVSLIGKNGPRAEQIYLIISSSSTITKNDIPKKRIGILDFLGREKLPLFVKESFGIDVPTLKRANKTEDLQTMLGMETVDAIIVPSSGYKEIMSSTKQSMFVIAESSVPVGGLVLAVKSGSDAAALDAQVIKASSAVSRDLGIEKWEGK